MGCEVGTERSRAALAPALATVGGAVIPMHWAGHDRARSRADRGTNGRTEKRAGCFHLPSDRLY